MKRTSPLLINEQPLQTLPSLACMVGINGAIILQQIHWWSRYSEHKYDGEIWIYNTYKEWSTQFKWLSDRAVQQTILSLEKSGHLISKQFPDKGNMKWYRVNYTQLVIDCENLNSAEFNTECLIINREGENLNSDSTVSSHKSRLNQRQSTHKSTHKSTKEDSSKVFTFYENEIGMLTPMIAEQLKDAITIFPPEWIIDAIKEAVKNNVRKWVYIEGILKSWAENGRRGKIEGRKSDDDPSKDDPDKYIKGRYGHMVRQFGKDG